MSMYDTERRYRRQLFGRIVRLLVTISVCVGIGIISYQIGVEDLQAEKRQHEQILHEMEGRLSDMAQRVANQALEVRRVKEQSRLIQGRYSEEVPQGAERALFDLMQARLSDGLGIDRLRFLITSARVERQCVAAETRRFLVRTPVSIGPRSAASFENDTITITGFGQSAKASDGRPQAWFDAAKPVRLAFAVIGEAEIFREGLLPFTHSVVAGDREFRFQVQSGKRGFVNVTSDNCVYP